MSSTTDLVDRYVDCWNETDPGHRRALIAEVWTEDATYVDPLMRGEGHSGIDAMFERVQAQFPGFRLRRTGDIDAHNDRLRFAWEFGPAGGDPLAGGVDFAVVANHRLQTLAGFIDFAPTSPGL